MEHPPILYITRRTPSEDAAFDHAVDLALRLDAGLTLAHVHRSEDPPSARDDGLALDRMAHEAERRGVTAETLLLGRIRHWTRELPELDWARWEVILKVAEPGGRVRRLLGTTVDQQLARAPRVPVWFVPSSRGADVRLVMAGVDMGHADAGGLNAIVVRSAAALASAHEARVDLVYAWSLVGESILTCPVRGMGRRRTSRAIRHLRVERRHRLETLAELGRLDADTTPVMARGLPEEALRRTAREVGADLLVLGTHRRRGWEGALVGNLAERFVGRDGLGVLILKPGSRVPRFAARGIAA